jgi:PEGA domain
MFMQWGRRPGTNEFMKLSASFLKRTSHTLRIALLMACISGLAEAQTRPVRDGLKPEARASFDRAVQAYSAQQWEQARQEFRDASGDARLLYNVAICEKSQGHFAAAVGTLRKVLTSNREMLDEKFVLAVTDSIAALTQETAELTVTQWDSGVQVLVDGKPGIEGRQGGTFLLDPGSRTITIQKPGFRTMRRELQSIRGTQLTIVESLERSSTAYAILAGDVKGGDVYIDGKRQGALPWIGPLALGQHEVRVEVPGYRSEKKTVIVSDEEASLTLALRSIEPMGTINASCDKADCSIFIDDRRVGTSSFTGQVAAGEHKLRFSAPDSETKFVEIALREGERRDLRVTPEAKKGISPWFFIAGGIVLAGATAVTVYVITRPTEYTSAAAGSLDPAVFVAHRPFL